MFKVKASRSGQELGTRIPVQCWEQKHGTLKTGFDGLVWIKIVNIRYVKHLKIQTSGLVRM